MNLIINNSSMQPIYEQIAEQIKTKIIEGKLREQDLLPSVRTLAKDLKVSALTIKKSYDHLESEGFIITVHGKGSFVAKISQELALEERLGELKREMNNIIRKARNSGISEEQIESIFKEALDD